MEGPGRDATQRLCTGCHGTEIIAAHRQGRDEWIATIQKMIAAGAEGTEDEFLAVLEYLAKNFGPAPPVHINQATAAELTRALGLAEKDAAAIVRYRTANGAFHAIEDLKKVPDLDYKTIEVQKDRLVF